MEKEQKGLLDLAIDQKRFADNPEFESEIIPEAYRIIKFLQSKNVPMLKRLLSNWKHIKVPPFEPLPVSSLPIPLQSSKGPTKGSGCAASMSTRLDFKTIVTF